MFLDIVALIHFLLIYESKVQLHLFFLNTRSLPTMAIRPVVYYTCQWLFSVEMGLKVFESKANAARSVYNGLCLVNTYQML